MYFQNAFNIQHFVTVGCETSCPTVTQCDCCRILNLPTNTQSHYVNSALLRYHRPVLSISLPLIYLTFRLHSSESVARFVVGIQNHIQMSLARCSDSQVVERRFLFSRYIPPVRVSRFFFKHSAFFECQSPILISCPGSLAALLETPHSMALANAKFPASFFCFVTCD